MNEDKVISLLIHLYIKFQVKNTHLNLKVGVYMLDKSNQTHSNQFKKKGLSQIIGWTRFLKIKNSLKIWNFF